MSSQDLHPKNIPIVSAIIQRVRNSEIEVLIQTRWNPDGDPVYSGMLEIPAGWIEEYESVYDVLKREVREETGLKITKVTPDIKTKIHSHHNDGAFAFVPFCDGSIQFKEGQWPILRSVKKGDKKNNAEEKNSVPMTQDTKLDASRDYVQLLTRACAAHEIYLPSPALSKVIGNQICCSYSVRLNQREIEGKAVAQTVHEAKQRAAQMLLVKLNKKI